MDDNETENINIEDNCNEQPEKIADLLDLALQNLKELGLEENETHEVTNNVSLLHYTSMQLRETDTAESGMEDKENIIESTNSGKNTDVMPDKLTSDSNLQSSEIAKLPLSEVPYYNNLGRQIPQTGQIAEIILISTSLGSIRRQFFASRRAQSFLDCKSVVYFLIDVNRDTSTAKNLHDIELFNNWKKEERLMKKNTDEKLEILIPQVIVDGVPIGDDDDLQDLEEDVDLDWIFARAACPSCLHEKDASVTYCNICGANLKNLVPMELVEEGKILQMYQGNVYNSAEHVTSSYEYPCNFTGTNEYGSRGIIERKASKINDDDIFGTIRADVTEEQ